MGEAEMTTHIPEFSCENSAVNQAYELAVSDLLSNVHPFEDGLLTEHRDCIMAGAGYDTPWTRDAAINVWNGAGLLLPEVSKNTLLSTLIRDKGQVRVGGQYWDAIIWAKGAEAYWLFNEDQAFRRLAGEAICNTLAYFEATEFDETRRLFRGPACYGDGVAAYPDHDVTGVSGILSFPEVFPERCCDRGVGIPMFALSTNCLYESAYRIAYRLTGRTRYLRQAEELADAINLVFWDSERGTYNYLLDDKGTCSSQEALGLSFAITLGIAAQEQVESILRTVHLSPNGIPVLYPCFDRYLPYGLGRHCGTVWPHAQAFWACAVAEKDPGKFALELFALTRNALRDGYFSEIYHPETGLPCGGAQEGGHGIHTDWVSQKHQTWSATGYLRMILYTVCGLHFAEDHLIVRPIGLKELGTVHLRSLRFRDMTLDLTISPRESGRPAQTTLPFQPGKVSLTL